MPTDIIEMFWGCTVCNAENKGRFKTCQNCGKPRTEASPEWMPGDVSPMAAVKDPELLHKFKAGSDWKCRFCGSAQFRADGNCAQCGSEQAESTGNTHKKSVKDKACRGELTKDDIERMFTKPNARDMAILHGFPPPPESDPFPEEPPSFIPDTGGYRDAPKQAERRTPPPVEAKDPEPLPTLPRFKPSLGGIIAVAGVVLVALILYLVFRTKVVNAEVATLSWDRTVSVDRYQVYRDEGWDVDNGAFDVHDEGRRVHHYDHVLVGSHTEDEPYSEEYQCGTNKGRCWTTPRDCKSNKNGSATCTGGDRVCDPDTPKMCTRTKYRKRRVNDYEDQPRYQTWYSWKVWRWGHQRDVRSNGSSTATHWPSEEQIQLNVGLAPGEQERIAGRTEHYVVVMVYDRERYTYEPHSDSEFQRFSVGDHHKIKVGIAHGVEILP